MAISNADIASPRLSDHFHKVRLTSLATSTVALFLCFHTDKGTLTLGGISLSGIDTTFVIVSAWIAATVSILHVYTLWYSETRTLSDQIQVVGTQIQAIHQIQGTFAMLRDDYSAFHANFGSGKGDSAGVHVEVLNLNYLQASVDGITGDGGDGLFVRTVNEIASSMSAGLQSIEPPFHSSWSAETKENLEALFYPTGGVPADQKIAGTRVRRGIDDILMDADQRYRQAHEKFVDDRVRQWRGLAMEEGQKWARKVRDSIELNRAETQKVNTYITDSEHKIENIRYSMLETFGPGLDRLFEALKPLRKYHNRTWLQIYLFDLGIGLSLYSIASCHVIGKTLGGSFMSAPLLTTAAINHINSLGSLAKIVFLAALFTAIILLARYAPRIRTMQAPKLRFLIKFVRGQRQSR